MDAWDVNRSLLVDIVGMFALCRWVTRKDNALAPCLEDRSWPACSGGGRMPRPGPLIEIRDVGTRRLTDGVYQCGDAVIGRQRLPRCRSALMGRDNSNFIIVTSGAPTALSMICVCARMHARVHTS